MRVVAFVLASNAVGTITDAQRVAELAREAGALVWVDAVHYAAHEPVDVQAIGCDVLLCSPYKFCGPHLGLAYGRHELLESWRPYKARPAGSVPVGRKFETGTAPYELLAGFSATIAYLESLGGMEVLKAYERELGQRFLDGLPDDVTIYGLQTMEGRVPTFLLNVDGVAGRRGRDDDGRARLRRVGARQLVLARPAREAAVPAGRGARRLHPLQHRRRGRRVPGSRAGVAPV